MIQIAIIEDKKQDQDLIISLLSAKKGFEIIGCGKDGYDALRLIEKSQPHIMILDLWEDNISGPMLVPLIKRKSPSTSIIILSGDDKDEYVSMAISAGASGFLLKKTDLHKLADSIRIVHKGGYFISTIIIVRTFCMNSALTKDQKAIQNSGGKKFLLPDTLSPIELQIMANIGRGCTNKEIAATLNLKPGTIRNYLSSILRKTGLKSRTQAAILALKSGLLQLTGLKQVEFKPPGFKDTGAY